MKIALLAGFLSAAAAAGPSVGRVAGSKHDLSVSGPGEIRAASERNPCVFCHVPHGGGERLGNRPEAVRTYRAYESQGLTRRAGAPSGASRVCLSCHDGTIAVGRTRTRSIEMAGGDRPMPATRRATLGTDLRGSHPVAVVPGGARTSPPGHGDPVKVDARGEVQCTSCHDPHSEFGDPDVGMFLVKPSADSALCRSCHPTLGSQESSHFTSSALVPATAERPARTVGAGGCASCHVSHHAPAASVLSRPGPTDDTTCLGCHDGTVARLSIANDVAKPSSHRSTGRGVHTSGEKEDRSSAARLPERSYGQPRHVACVDCHDPHGATDLKAAAPAAPGALAGQWGIAIDGQRVAPARFEYEVCLKCHGDSLNRRSSLGVAAVRRRSEDGNLRLVFDPAAPSFHPVAAPGRNPNVPSLIPPLGVASMIYCTDCHASDSGPGAGGVGARGPHGSVYPSLLERQYLTGDFTPESPAAYALCYKCHDRDVLLSDASPFPHRSHVVTGSAPCSACHAAHGVSSVAGDPVRNAHLVSFDLNIARANGASAPEYTASGASHGSCNLTCHSRPHDDLTGRY